MHRIRWDDLQYVLAVANEGSLSAAARALGVNHSTVLRRLESFEYRHKVQVFHKLATGYKLTVEGNELLESALSIASEVKDLERRLSGKERELEGELRVTTTDSLLRLVLGKHLATFHRLYPRITLSLTVTPQQLALSQLESDVAIRIATTLDERLVGHKLCRISFGVYGSAEYVAKLQGKKVLTSAHWLEMRLASTARFISSDIPAEMVVLRADSYEPLLVAAEQGMGLVCMPCFIGESSDKLQRVDMPLAGKPIDLYVISHKDLAGSAKVKAFFEFIKRELKDDYHRIAGLGGA
ncbi:LysR family transcriptional regulator [Marinomonas pollencensis]|uniref:DNA-binding transcriptional LysR family regulator n=1 Tax=Marinomonas pollencensis TaxID=491954 RepID=A0A3E0DHC9_9GAMM|nr:LysR family transcriptional regulator [Marinomonas pollencensis]REG81995.1 DNA-binding transcriptional LysR family regulator [Marinomonas pollencensis]